MFDQVARGVKSGKRGVSKTSAPDDPYIINLNTLLHDIYLRYIALNDEDFEKYYSVVESIFQQMHEAMKDVDCYYNRNSSTVQFAGSHPDKLRINKSNEFDIDIVIGLPLNINQDALHPEKSDFVIEPKDPGFVQLRMGVQYDRLPLRFRRNWHENSAAYRWRGKKNYLQRSKFMDWFKGVVNSALNEFYHEENESHVFEVDGEVYTVCISESGPAMTLYIENMEHSFKLDVDLVPALRFPIDRCPISSVYRPIPDPSGPSKNSGEFQRSEERRRPAQKSSDYFMLVPKPIKSGTEVDRSRSWRLAMHEQERMLFHDTQNMRPAIRLMKKFRDAQNMEKIASYYIKTMFFWEAMEHEDDEEFWNNSPAYLFEYMLYKFHKYLVAKRLPYFWHKDNNLLQGIDSATLTGYANKVQKLLHILTRPKRYRQVAKLLLTKKEFEEYKRYLY